MRRSGGDKGSCREAEKRGRIEEITVMKEKNDEETSRWYRVGGGGELRK